MKCSDCGRTNPPGGFLTYLHGTIPVCKDSIECRIHQRDSAKAPDKVLRKVKAPGLPGMESES